MPVTMSDEDFDVVHNSLDMMVNEFHGAEDIVKVMKAERAALAVTTRVNSERQRPPSSEV